MSTSNVDLAMSSVYAQNRELIDADSDRAFLVRDGTQSDDGESDSPGGAVARPVEGGPDAGTPPVHPEFEERGRREIPVEDSVFIEREDLPPVGERVWLKGFGCVHNTGSALEFVDAPLSVTREEAVDIVHWVPVDASVDVRLRTPEGDVSGYAEPGVGDYRTDDTLQFERVGFARVDATAPLVAYFAHR
jgi:glutamyl-tRNA synthetase